MQFKELLKQIFEVCFMAWGITEDTFLYDGLSLALTRLVFFLKEEFSLVLRVKSNPHTVNLCKLYCISLESLVQYIQYKQNFLPIRER